MKRLHVDDICIISCILELYKKISELTTGTI